MGSRLRSPLPSPDSGRGTAHPGAQRRGRSRRVLPEAGRSQCLWAPRPFPGPSASGTEQSRGPRSQVRGPARREPAGGQASSARPAPPPRRSPTLPAAELGRLSCSAVHLPPQTKPVPSPGLCVSSELHFHLKPVLNRHSLGIRSLW